jgi:predicted XRE-type DNA-binding protein
MKHLTGRKKRALVKSHLHGIKRALLEGEMRPAFLEFLNQNGHRRGVYALYGNTGRLYYIGKASDLKTRLNQHLKDKHAESWDQMTLLFLNESADVAELEGLMLAIANPKGNKQRPHIGRDLRSDLRKFLKADKLNQIDQAVYPDRKQAADKISGRITPKRLRTIKQETIANVLGISQSQVSILINQDRKKFSKLRQYIQEGGHRDKIILMLDKNKSNSRE